MTGAYRLMIFFQNCGQYAQLGFAFVLRCSKGDLRAEVKRVVWHEVAHWLGYETEEQSEGLGLMSHYQLVDDP